MCVGGKHLVASNAARDHAQPCKHSTTQKRRVWPKWGIINTFPSLLERLNCKGTTWHTTTAHTVGQQPVLLGGPALQHRQCRRGLHVPNLTPWRRRRGRRGRRGGLQEELQELRAGGWPLPWEGPRATLKRVKRVYSQTMGPLRGTA